ncbi:MAG: hypothetical protein ACK4ZJ_18495, partial [Allorhizobium sp.]
MATPDRYLGSPAGFSAVLDPAATAERDLAGTIVPDGAMPVQPLSADGTVPTLVAHPGGGFMSVAAAGYAPMLTPAAS